MSERSWQDVMIENFGPTWMKQLYPITDMGKLAEQLVAKDAEINQLREELKLERECVDFYADHESYKTVETKYDHYPTIIGDNDFIQSTYCGGKRVRTRQAERKEE